MENRNPERETTNTLLPGQQRSYNKWLALLVALFLVTTIIFSILYGIEKGKANTTTTMGPMTTTTPTESNTTTPITPTPTTISPEGPVCVTPYCIKAADYLLNSIDETADPCEDFYQFACGTWLKNARIPEDSGVQNVFNLLDTQLTLNLIGLLSSANETGEPNAVVNARNLYNSCVNESAVEDEGVEAVLAIVNRELGGWPILSGSQWDPSTFNLPALLLNLRRYDDGMLFSVATNTNQENSSVYSIELGQGTLGLQNKEFYYDNASVIIPQAYRQFMRDLALALNNGTGINETEIEEMYAFEKDISTYYWNAADESLRDNETIRTTVGNLSTSLPSRFDFSNHLRQTYIFAEVHLTEYDVVLVNEPSYLTNVANITLDYPIRVVQNYLVWRFLMNRASSMPKQIRSTREQFDRAFKGTTAEPTRATVCANFVNDNMGFAVSRLYVQKYFDDEARNQSKHIIANIRTSMIDAIHNATWMDDESREKAVDKETAIAENIGYPDFIVGDNVTKLEEMYAAYVFNGSLADNALELQRITVRENLGKLRDPVDRHAWGDLPPTVVNAFYEPSTNSISFPAGILQTPFFDRDAPKYLNYGGIGMVIGHEITHGFDDEGRQYDKDGNRIPWWTNSTVEKFNEKKECIIEQYSNYTVAQINEKLNGVQTQGENIADNGGIKSSFYAYQRWAAHNPNTDHRLPGLNYTQEQLFFMGYAHGWCAKFTDQYARVRVLNDVHSIPQFRVLGPLSNFAEFDRVFSCKPGQGDSRVNKCAVW